MNGEKYWKKSFEISNLCLIKGKKLLESNYSEENTIMNYFLKAKQYTEPVSYSHSYWRNKNEWQLLRILIFLEIHLANEKFGKSQVKIYNDLIDISKILKKNEDISKNIDFSLYFVENLWIVLAELSFKFNEIKRFQYFVKESLNILQDFFHNKSTFFKEFKKLDNFNLNNFLKIKLFNYAFSFYLTARVRFLTLKIFVILFF